MRPRRVIYPETAVMRLPAGANDAIHAAAQRNGTTAAMLMREVILRAVAYEPVPAEDQAQEVAS